MGRPGLAYEKIPCRRRKGKDEDDKKNSHVKRTPFCGGQIANIIPDPGGDLEKMDKGIKVEKRANLCLGKKAR